MNDESDHASRQDVQASGLAFPVVGLGASAGGLEALITFFEQMPADNGMAFVVILHLSPKHESGAADILQRATRMPVMQVTHAEHIRPNHVYVISPARQLTMYDGCLHVADAGRPRGRHVAIDLFFRTLAQAHRQHAISIVLSGTGSDGTLGIAQIKEQGGMTIAQTPDDCRYDGMPRSAIATGMVDFVLPVAEMPQKLISLWANAQKIKVPDAEALKLPVEEPEAGNESEAAEHALQDILKTLRSRTGNDFRHYKRATVLRRIERRLQVSGLPDLVAYQKYLRSDPHEPVALLKDMLISVTNFFRDREIFDFVEREVMPSLFENRNAEEQIRVWSAGCATGEEAYSLAMLLIEQAAQAGNAPEVLVFATDIDERALAVGRTALYPQSIVTDISPGRLRNFFVREQDQYRLKKSVREKVLFAVHNILRDPPFSRLDVISCRNLLIYLDREVQAKILEMFHFALRPGGYLLLGSSESADAAPGLFAMVDKKSRVYRANVVARSGRVVPTMPLGRPTLELPDHDAQTRRSSATSFADIHQRSLREYAPPSVLIDSDHNIVHLSEHASRYLRHAGGKPSHDLLLSLHPDLRLELRTALYQAQQTGQSVESRRVRMHRDSGDKYVNIVVRPLQEATAPPGLTLVLFLEVDTPASTDVSDALATESLVVRHLEDELRRTKEQLQTVIEQAETSTEELKASNEELQAINEELRSATEELETSKEELQSTNEELITVNYELKCKVEETGKANDDLQNLIASTDIGTVFVDKGMRIKRYTPRVADVFSIIPGDIGRSLFDLTHRLEYPQFNDDAIEVAEYLRPVEREVRSTDGKWFIVRMLPYRTVEDRIDGIVLTFIDISRRRGAEEKVVAGEEQLSLVLASMRDYAIITTDLDGAVVTWNQGAEQMFGYRTDEIAGRPISAIYSSSDGPPAALADELKRAWRHGSVNDDRWCQHRNGDRIYCNGTITLLGEGEPRGFAMILRDLTERQRLAEEREALLARESEFAAQARAASAMKDEFLAVMSHELKHPLNLIQVNAELLARLPELRGVSRVADFTGTIRRAVTSQAKIIDDMLDLSRIQTGKLPLNRTPTDLAALVQDILAAVNEEISAKKLTVSFSADDEHLLVDADPVRTEQIVWNLVSNAIKFTPSGGSIDVHLSAGDHGARFDITDSGCGIDPQAIAKVFNMFEQADTGTLRRHGGLGIGLALVRQLAELHGGKVAAHSDGIGHGARFSAWLPLASGAEDRAPTHAVHSSEVLAGRKLLLVDDQIDTLASFAALLQLEGVDVTVATGGREAATIAAKQPFDLIISDLGMPGVDGYQFIEMLRGGGNNAATPAIAVSGYSRPADRKRSAAAGFDAHLSKPVSIEMIAEVVSALVQKKAGK